MNSHLYWGMSQEGFIWVPLESDCAAPDSRDVQRGWANHPVGEGEWILPLTLRISLPLSEDNIGLFNKTKRQDCSGDQDYTKWPKFYTWANEAEQKHSTGHSNFTKVTAGVQGMLIHIQLFAFPSSNFFKLFWIPCPFQGPICRHWRTSWIYSETQGPECPSRIQVAKPSKWRN